MRGGARDSAASSGTKRSSSTGCSACHRHGWFCGCNTQASAQGHSPRRESTRKSQSELLNVGVRGRGAHPWPLPWHPNETAGQGCAWLLGPQQGPLLILSETLACGQQQARVPAGVLPGRILQAGPWRPTPATMQESRIVPREVGLRGFFPGRFHKATVKCKANDSQAPGGQGPRGSGTRQSPAA